MNLYILAIVIFGQLLSGCDLLLKEVASSNKSEVKDHDASFLGAGYLAKFGKVTSRREEPCVVGDSKQPFNFFPNPTATLTSKFSRDYDYHYEKLNLTVGGGAGPLKVQVDFLDALEHSQLSVALVTEFDYNYGTFGINKPRLSEYVNSVADDNQRLKDCGDEFIDQIDVGANFMAAVVFNFKDRHKNLKLSLQVILDLFLAQVTVAEIGAGDFRNDVETSVDLKVSQVGGDQQKFAAAKKNLDLQQCGFVKISSETTPDYKPDLERCLKQYNKALDYARTSFKDRIAQARLAKPDSQGLPGLALKEARGRRYDSAGFWWFQADAKKNDDMLRLLQLQESLNKELSFYRGALMGLDAIERDATLRSDSVFNLSKDRLALARASYVCAKQTTSKLEAIALLCEQRSSTSYASCLDALSNIRLQKVPYLPRGGEQRAWPEDDCKP